MIVACGEVSKVLPAKSSLLDRELRVAVWKDRVFVGGNGVGRVFPVGPQVAGGGVGGVLTVGVLHVQKVGVIVADGGVGEVLPVGFLFLRKV